MNQSGKFVPTGDLSVCPYLYTDKLSDTRTARLIVRPVFMPLNEYSVWTDNSPLAEIEPLSAGWPAWFSQSVFSTHSLFSDQVKYKCERNVKLQ